MVLPAIKVTTKFIFISDRDEEEGEPNPMSGLRSRAGRLYLKGAEPEGEFLIKEICCARQARRFRLGMSIDDFNLNLKRLYFGQLEYL